MPTSDLPPTRNSVATAQYPFPLSAPHDDASLNARGNLVLDYHIESYNVADQAQTSQEWFDMGMETWQDVTNIDAGEATTERLHHVDTFNDVAAPISVELSSREGGEELDSSVHRTLVPNTVESGMSFSNGTSSAGPGTGSSSASYPAWDSPADSFNHIGASSPTTTISAMGGDLETLNTMTTGGPDDGLSSAVVLGVVNDFDDQDLMEWDRPGPYPQSFMNPAQDQEPNSGETYKDAQS